MHERHDLDLIAAFAREALADASPARALIESCPECAEYYRATRLVLEAVRTDPAPRLTDLERYRLHRAIWEEVAPEAPAASPTSRGRWWYRLAGAAAALAAVVAVGGVLGNGRAAEEPTMTTAARELFTAAPDAMADRDETLAPLSAGAEAFDTTEAASSAAGAGEAADGAGAPTVVFSAADLPEVASAFTDRVSAGEAVIEPTFDCAEWADADDLLAAEPAEMDGEPVWLLAHGERDAPSVEVVDAAECVVVYPNG